MKRLWVFLALTWLPALHADAVEPQVVTIPYMEREAPHRIYADKLLELAMALSKDRYGPYRIVQQQKETAIGRQLLLLAKGDSLSVAVAMPTQEWLDGALPVRIPIMRGLSSLRFFLGHARQQAAYDAVSTVDDLKNLTIGQGLGWSTVKILEDSGFKIAYGGAHATLIPMLNSGRFDLLMRGVFELGPEWKANHSTYPGLRIVDRFAVYTYMPMYFFVARNQPELVERLEYGLKAAYANGQLDRLFNQYFSNSLKLLNNPRLKIFYIPNTNIDQRFFERDKPYLLETIVALEKQAASARQSQPPSR